MALLVAASLMPLLFNFLEFCVLRWRTAAYLGKYLRRINWSVTVQDAEPSQ
jgi:hypothetical protein